jgi:hypothetical protein
MHFDNLFRLGKSTSDLGFKPHAVFARGWESWGLVEQVTRFIVNSR